MAGDRSAFFIENEVNADFGFDIEDLAAKVAGSVFEIENFNFDVEIGLTITDDDGIKELNSQFRGIDRETDVLSFPNVSYESAGDYSVLEDDSCLVDVINPDTGKIMFGDIVINEKRVFSQALEYGHSVKREFAFLLAHSLLHLCGYDHETEDEAAVMEAKQEEALSRIGITRD